MVLRQGLPALLGHRAVIGSVARSDSTVHRRPIVRPEIKRASAAAAADRRQRQFRSAGGSRSRGPERCAPLEHCGRQQDQPSPRRRPRRRRGRLQAVRLFRGYESGCLSRDGRARTGESRTVRRTMSTARTGAPVRTALQAERGVSLRHKYYILSLAGPPSQMRSRSLAVGDRRRDGDLSTLRYRRRGRPSSAVGRKSRCKGVLLRSCGRPFR